MSDVATEIAGLDHWYHTIELPGGVTTPGLYDMPRAVARVGMPQSLAGKRCLDVATADGFWAFEMERRGASEVVAVDLEGYGALDWPPAVQSVPQIDLPARSRFKLAHSALGSAVKWLHSSVYDLDPGIFGSFDFAFIGSTLIHLRDPVRALAQVRSVVRGDLLVNEAVSVALTLLHPRLPAARLVAVDWPAWWVPNVAGLRRMVESAGYEVRARGGPYMLRFGKGRATSPEHPKRRLRATPLREVPLELARRATSRIGVPHAWVLASPKSG